MSSCKQFLLANLGSTGRHMALSQLDQHASDVRKPASRRRGGRGHGRHAGRAGGRWPHGGSRKLPGKLIVTGLTAVLTILTLPAAFATTAAAPNKAAARVVWLAANSSVANLADVNPSLAARTTGARGTMIQATARVTSNPVPAGYRSLPTERWTSEARFAADAAAGAIPRYIRAAHYDNEKWSDTPLAEQRQPSLYEKKFCQVAHAHGLLCVTSPGRDLCPVAYPNSGTLNQCYLSHNLAGNAARYADYTDIQGEVNELHGTAVYAAFIRRAAAQAKAANPRNITLGNLNATPDGHSVTASAMAADARAVFGRSTSRVAGFYITITNAGARTTAKFMQLFEPRIFPS
jgi:hypothetical protein